MNLSRISLFVAVSLTISVLTGCGDGGDTKSPEEDGTKASEAQKDPSTAGLVKIGDKLFNLPSPLETAFLIEEVGGHFTEDLMNGEVDATKYTTKNTQAMNLGIYGADLGYSLIYGQSQKAFTLLATCKKLGQGLGINPSIYTSMMKRFEGNMENRDSLLIMIAQMNSLSDEYLKENESEDVSSLILYGGWVESLYFTTNLTKQLDDPKLRSRVGEQKNSLENLIGLMQQSNADGQLDGVVSELQALQTIFNKVEYNYEWVEPETKTDKNLTIIKSKSTVNVSEEVLKEITDKITEIRNSIISTTA
jgi:hypothetical protein